MLTPSGLRQRQEGGAGSKAETGHCPAALATGLAEEPVHGSSLGAAGTRHRRLGRADALSTDLETAI